MNLFHSRLLQLFTAILHEGATKKKDYRANICSRLQNEWLKCIKTSPKRQNLNVAQKYRK